MNQELRFETSQFVIDFAERPGIAGMSCEAGAALAANPAELANIWMLYSTETEICTDIADTAAAVAYECTREENGVLWCADIEFGGEHLSAKIRAQIDGDTVRFTVSDFVETEKARIVMLRLNGLAAAVQSDANARLALPNHGGRLIDPVVCADGQTDHRYNWILDSFGSAAVVYTDRMTAVVRIHLMDDQLTSEVGGVEGGRYAQMGALLRHRYTINDASYRKAKPDRDPKNVEDAEELAIERDFALPQDPCVTIELIAHDAVSPANGWTIGARHVRDSLSGKRTDMYRDRMIYKIFVGAPNQPVATNLEQIRKLVFDLAARTGSAGQLPYLVGFQHRGHDSAYPDVFTLNPALESVEALRQLFEDAMKVNCMLSFHDNYDDAYADSPSWCAEDISRDSLGHLLRGGVWNGVQSYWNSMPFYAKNRAGERIRRTLETYPFLHDTYHLDVLTASVFRIDFRGGDPTGRQQDLEARLSIAEQFRARNLDLTSEACGLPFVGTMSYFWHMQRVPRSLYKGDVRIPMVTFLVHGKADYAGTHTDTPRNILDGLLYGGFYCNDVTASTPVKELTDAYFMVQAPLNALRDDLALGYEERGGFKTVHYASGASVSVNFESEECAVTIGGKRWIENGSAMIPQADGTTVLYRSWEEPYDPVFWNSGYSVGTKLTAKPLGVDLPEEKLTVGEDGLVAVELPIGVGFVVTKAAE